MDNPKPKHLFKAARAGDAAKIRELLAAGAPLEATDLNGLTPVMAAAQAGQGEAFHTLVEAGANLNALGLDQTDLLECAAEGGNAEIVRFLLERGLPVEGHWQPRSLVARRQGHITPLMSAAINGHVEAVHVLLAAGANRERMAEFCPPVLDEGAETAAELARAISRSREFLLRWD
ncbi:MAG: ankyrin repeat domain-containing protein [Gemmataceae bacterium]